jgi:hypothetical protein
MLPPGPDLPLVAPPRSGYVLGGLALYAACAHSMVQHLSIAAIADSDAVREDEQVLARAGLAGQGLANTLSCWFSYGMLSG